MPCDVMRLPRARSFVGGIDSVVARGSRSDKGALASNWVEISSSNGRCRTPASRKSGEE